MKRWRRPLLWAAAALVLGWAAHGTEFHPSRFRDFGNMVHFIRRMFPPDWSIASTLLPDILVTLQIALMGTWLAFVIAFPLSFAAARNVAGSRWIYLGVRNLLSLFRAVPMILWALIFVVSFGIGPLPGVLALAVHNAGLLGKVLSELMESAEIGPQEAVAAAGAPRSLVVWYGILPQVTPNMLSYTFYRFECNVRESAVLGFVGAGGIGQSLLINFRMFLYEQVVLQVLAVLLLVIAVDFVGAWIRRRVI